jgi:hypothetical protein
MKSDFAIILLLLQIASGCVSGGSQRTAQWPLSLSDGTSIWVNATIPLIDLTEANKLDPDIPKS